ncbi:MAG: mucoidy inhibitor MuiA family protein, partial [Candidatus Promineifilaceae bacterium]
AKVKIASVDVRRSFYERAPAELVRNLEDQIQGLTDQRQVLEDEESILEAQQEYLSGLRTATSEYAKGIARGKTKIEDYAHLADFLSESERKVRTSVRELEIQYRELDEKLEKLEKELSRLTTSRSKQGYEAWVDVSVESGGSFKLNLSYLVRMASWQPLYDIRLRQHEDGYKLDITVLAEVKQNTGQEWEGIALSVSTSRPSLSQRAPELKPWYIDEFRPIPVPAPKSQGAGGHVRIATAPAAAMSFSADSEPLALEESADYIVAEIDSTGPSTTFHIAGESFIAGSGVPHKTIISEMTIQPELDYLAVPKQVDSVYRRIKAANEMASPLLPGSANLFSESDFIGSVAIDYISPGDEIELLFGTEDRITIERELIQRAVEKTRLRDRRELTYGYKITVKNLMAEDVKVEVQDHAPVARHEEIKVDIEKVDPKPIELSDLNLIKWEVMVQQNTEKSIQYEYTVSHPRQMRVVGLIE